MKYLAVTALLATACAGSNASTKPTVPAESGYASVLTAVDMKGARVGPLPADKQATLMVVFASWCGPCRHELATLGELRTKQPKLRIIGLNAYEEWSNRSNIDRLKKFLGESAPWLRVVRADQKMLKRFGGVQKVPTVFVYDGQGRLVSEFRRSMRAPPTLDELEAVVTKALRRN